MTSSYSQQDLLDALHTAITTAATEIPSVYSTVIPKDAPFPYAVVTMVSDSVTPYMGDVDDDIRCLVQVDLYAHVEFGARALRAAAEKVHRALHKQQLTVSNAGNVSVFCSKRFVVRPETNSVLRAMAEFMVIGSEA